MWCTRWYLPLVLLPLPIAPPYLLVLFLFSTTLHAKPCFYCIILLTAMYMASCYWPPVPLDTPLSSPWADNITTFADALLSRMPDLPAEMLPATIPIVERCWCDFSTGFFESFNSTRWEVSSVEHLRRELEKKLEVRSADHLAAGDRDLDTNTTANATNQPSPLGATDKLVRQDGLTSTVKALWSYLSHPPVAQSPETFLNSSAAQGEEDQEPAPRLSEPPQPALSPLRKEYDLRPYGFDMVLDFGF